MKASPRASPAKARCAEGQELPSPRAAAAAAVAAASAAAALAGCADTSSEWMATLAEVSKAVVVLKMTSTRSFDTEVASSGYATGFVVDSERGIILTNRHVVKPGPVVAEAVFLNREEVPVRAVYRDPVHDFGFFAFDPAKLQFMECTHITLAPEAAAVGLEVRVVGNDSGDKLSILSGTIARLDREAPFYGKNSYNDENTFYLQAASGTKGGSSGSPVVDVRGRAVGLNAGSRTKSASAFFLPLQRVARALALLQRDVPARVPPAVPRGTLAATFGYKGFDEVRRLGLRRTTEAAVRAAAAATAASPTGMLVVDATVPGGPAYKALEPGDVVVRLNGAFLSDFLQLEAALDDDVGGGVTLEVERGGEPMAVTMQVGDAHAGAPDRFLEAWGAVLHALSLQQARNFAAPAGLCYVADPGYCLGNAGVPRFAIITAVGDAATPDVDAAGAALAALPPGARVPVRYYTFGDRHRIKTGLLRVASHWFEPPTFHRRCDVSGLWHAAPAAPAASVIAAAAAAKRPAEEAADAGFAPREAKRLRGGSGRALLSSLFGGLLGVSPPPPPPAVAGDDALEPAVAAVAPALVQVQADIPPTALADGVVGKSFKGGGLIVALSADGMRGWALTDRNTTPIAAADARVAFAAHPSEAPARVVWLSPIHNFAVLEFDASGLPAAARAALRCAELDAAPLHRGDAVSLVGLSASLRPLSRRSHVTDASHALAVPPAEVPRFRAVNEEVVELDDDFGSYFSGVLVDEEGAVRALWASYSKQVSKDEDREFVRGLPIELVAAAVAAARACAADASAATLMPAQERFLDVELEPVHLTKASGMGLPEAACAVLAAADPTRRQALRVAGVPLGSPARGVLREGDFLLRLDATPVTCFRDCERAAAAAAARGDGAEAQLAATVWRAGGEVAVVAGLKAECTLGTRRLLHWAGAQLQATHRAVLELGFAPGAAAEGPVPAGVFVSRWHHGSPAHRWGLYALSWITAVNGAPTPDLEAFADTVRGLPDGADVRLHTVTLGTKPKVLTLRLDTHYWPTYELACDARGDWSRHDVKQ